VQLHGLQRNCVDQVLHTMRSRKSGFHWSNHLVFHAVVERVVWMMCKLDTLQYVT
jgi:ABC-type cobalamin transport system permease subunit